MQWGLIGTGGHAERIAAAIGKTRGERLAGVVGSSPDKAAAFVARTGVGVVFPTLEALLQDAAIEAIFIATPNERHRLETEQAAAAGKHVLVEKPMALTADDCQSMIAKCRAAGVKLGIGFQARHHPVHREIRRAIAEGELGDLVLLQGEWLTAYPPWRNWRADPARAGSDVLGAVGVHVLDLLSFLAGADVVEPAAIVDTSPETRMDQTLAVSLRFENGCLGAATMTRRSRAPFNVVRALGTRGTITGIGTLGMVPTGRMQKSDGSQIAETTLPVPDLLAVQFDAFAHAVATDTEPSASGTDGLNSVLLSERLLRRPGSG